MITLSKAFEFSASHRLFRPDWSEEKNKETFGKCTNLHGHNYRLEVGVAGEPESDTGMIIDANQLQKIVDQEVISQLDHKNLNSDVPWLEGKLPSTEVLVDAIWQRLEEPIKLAAPSGQLKKITLWETRKIFASKEI